MNHLMEWLAAITGIIGAILLFLIFHVLPLGIAIAVGIWIAGNLF